MKGIEGTIAQRTGAEGRAPRAEADESQQSCYSHVVRKVAEFGFELPEEYVSAACSPEQWACELKPGVDALMAGDVVEMKGDGDARHVGVMLDRVTLEHLDVRRSALQRVPLSAIVRAGVLVRVLRPYRRSTKPYRLTTKPGDGVTT